MSVLKHFNFTVFDGNLWKDLLGQDNGRGYVSCSGHFKNYNETKDHTYLFVVTELSGPLCFSLKNMLISAIFSICLCLIACSLKLLRNKLSTLRQPQNQFSTIVLPNVLLL